MLRPDLVVSVHEIQGELVADGDQREGAEQHRRWQAEQRADEQGGGLVIARRDDRVIELHRHGCGSLVAAAAASAFAASYSSSVIVSSPGWQDLAEAR